MEQGPSLEAKRFSARQKIPQILWNPKVHYRIHKCNIIVPCIFKSPKYSLLFRSSSQSSVNICHTPLHATCTTHYILAPTFPVRQIVTTKYLRAHLSSKRSGKSRSYSSTLLPPQNLSLHWLLVGESDHSNTASGSWCQGGRSSVFLLLLLSTLTRNILVLLMVLQQSAYYLLFYIMFLLCYT